jgi:hypothetical protein
MRRSAVVVLAWGILLAAMTVLQAPFGPRPIEYAMLGAASVAALIVGGALAVTYARRRRDGALLVGEESVATATLATGLALALLGAGFGLWLILIGAGVVALGIGGLVREALARARSASRRRDGAP